MNQPDIQTQPAVVTSSNEQRVIRQLLEALLFEQIIDYDYQLGRFNFAIGNDHYQAAGYIGGFERIRLDETSIRQNQSGEQTVPNLCRLVNSLSANAAIKQQLLSELTQTISLCNWNSQQTKPHSSRRHLNYRELEAAIDEGHPYHPCFKARTGFSLEDHENYGPEQAPTFQLHWLAVRRPYLKQRLNKTNDSDFWQHELGLKSWALLQQRMAEQNISWSNHSLLPIHPWQWSSLEQELLAPIQQGHLVYLGAAGDLYQPTISVRTLLNVTNPDKATIKLPMNMVNTSSLRKLPPHSVCTAPVLSEWLKNIIENDSFFQQHRSLGMQVEYAGLLVTNDASDNNENPAPELQWLEKLAGQLGVIFRESLERQHDNATALPFVALAVTEADGKPFIAPWIEQYGCEDWLKQLIDVAIIPIWHLLVHHGIALEAHAQNMVLIHKDGWPEKIIVRDFHESVEYVENYLASAEQLPDFLSLEACYQHGEDNQYFWMTHVEALRELLVDTLFVYNLCELAALMREQYQFCEDAFWSLLDSRLQAYNDAGHTSQERIEQIDIHQPQIQTESLMHKKLSGNSDLEFHHLIKNPLAETHQN